MSKTKILVVDDEEDILELVRYNLLTEGYTVKCTPTGEDAIRLALSEPLDLMVLDLMLPKMNGVEVARILRSDPKTRQLPIVMLTAKCEEPDIIS